MKTLGPQVQQLTSRQSAKIALGYRLFTVWETVDFTNVVYFVWSRLLDDADICDLQKECFLPTLPDFSRLHLYFRNRCLHIYYEPTSCIHGCTFSYTCIIFPHNQCRKNHFPGLLLILKLFCRFCRCFLNPLV